MANRIAEANVDERRQQAFELRKAGTSYRAIGRALGVTHTAAKRYVDYVLDRLRRDTQADAERYRTLHLERLADMLRALWPSVIKGDQGAIREARACMEREAKLMGLDAPVSVEHVLKEHAKKLAESMGLDEAEVLADAERILAGLG